MFMARRCSKLLKQFSQRWSWLGKWALGGRTRGARTDRQTRLHTGSLTHALKHTNTRTYTNIFWSYTHAHTNTQTHTHKDTGVDAKHKRTNNNNMNHTDTQNISHSTCLSLHSSALLFQIHNGTENRRDYSIPSIRHTSQHSVSTISPCKRKSRKQHSSQPQASNHNSFLSTRWWFKPLWKQQHSSLTVAKQQRQADTWQGVVVVTYGSSGALSVYVARSGLCITFTSN